MAITATHDDDENIDLSDLRCGEKVELKWPLAGLLRAAIEGRGGVKTIFYNDVIDQDDYDRQHCRCPQCGSEHLCVTCIGIIVEPLPYRDRNRANCGDCGWEGIVDDLVPARGEAA